MDLASFLGILVSIFALALVLIGVPAQIAKNYREKRSGQPLLTILIAIGFYASQIAFFFATNAYLPLVSFVIGILMWGIVLIQYFLYAHPRDRDQL
ncbi:hypothetical protein C4552_01455 [Candidatus Parcubacteria bacterium]|nr:MAG: hypothetical protein C4552_01455 [Candidatus Parcubacteria bacterium]